MAIGKYRALVLSGKSKVSVEMMEPKPLEPGQVRVKFAAGGICGSDMHYYKDYGNVGYPLKNPVAMGHEASGVIAEIGPGVQGLEVGDKVAVNPVLHCGLCLPCRRGEANLCVNKRFPGSAMNYPHIDGFFREYFETRAQCCVKVPADSDLRRIAFAEPLSCSLHAVRQAGDLLGKSVLVTGSGPIGILAAMGARMGGAARVTITDIANPPLETAKKLGVDATCNTTGMSTQDMVDALGPVDVAIDASGAPSAIVGGLHALRKGGVFVQLGSAPADGVKVPWVFFTTREIKVMGSLQFNTEFETSVQSLVAGRLDPLPMLTKQFKFEEADEAFAFAGDRQVCVKAQFTP